MELSLWHIVIMLATVFAVIGAGLWAARSVNSAEGYSLNGRSAGVPLIAGSIAGSIVGGGATIGTAQLAYTCGLSAWWFTLGAGITFIIMGIFYARKLRGTGLATIPEFLAAHYGVRAEEAASVISSIGTFFSIIASSLSGIQLLSALFHVPHAAAAAILIVLVVGYTFFGGMKSAGIGGILKMGVLFLSLAIAGISAFLSLSAMPDAEFDALFPAMPWLSLTGNGAETAAATFLSMMVGVICTQTYVQAIFSAATPTTAAAGCIASACIVIPVGLPFIAIGMYMRAFDPSVLPILVLPTYLVDHEGVIIAGIALGGILLSLISSIGGLALGMGTMISHDIAGVIFRIRNDRLLLHITKFSVLAILIAAGAFSLYHLESQVLFWNYLSMALRGGGIFLPMTLAIFRPGHVAPRWGLAAITVSTGAAVLTATVFPLPIDPVFVGLAISAVLLFIGCLRRA